MTELSYLDKKILENSIRTKKTLYTYKELEVLISPFHVEDYILTSKILYEKEPNLFELIPEIKEKVLSHNEPKGSQNSPEGNKTEFGGVSRGGNKVFGGDRSFFREQRYRDGETFSRNENKMAYGNKRSFEK